MPRSTPGHGDATPLGGSANLPFDAADWLVRWTASVFGRRQLVLERQPVGLAPVAGWSLPVDGHRLGRSSEKDVVRRPRQSVDRVRGDRPGVRVFLSVRSLGRMEGLPGAAVEANTGDGGDDP